MKRWEVQIVQYFITDGYTNREYRSFSSRKGAVRYAFNLNNDFRKLYATSPVENQFLWEIKVIEIKTIRSFNGR